MNDRSHMPPLGPTTLVGETLLADTAIRIELPPSLHQLAVDRSEAVRKHIERVGSPLRDRVRLFYPQGSMAIRATITSRKRQDGFDIDLIAELLLSPTLPPREVLDLLYESINGQPGSLYYGMVERRTRCVTVFYEDGIHLDITPAVLVDENDPRKSLIFHAKAEEPVALYRRILMNSFAFVELFNASAPIDLPFAMAYAKRVQEFDFEVFPCGGAIGFRSRSFHDRGGQVIGRRCAPIAQAESQPCARKAQRSHAAVGDDGKVCAGGGGARQQHLRRLGWDFCPHARGTGRGTGCGRTG